MKAVSLIEKLDLIKETWSPHIIGDFNDCYVKLAKFEGEFTFHAHDDSDELFYAVSGDFTLVYRDREEVVKEGSMAIVPKGVDHHTRSTSECSVLIIGRKSSDHTGGVDDPRRKDSFPRI